MPTKPERCNRCHKLFPIGIELDVVHPGDPKDTEFFCVGCIAYYVNFAREHGATYRDVELVGIWKRQASIATD